MSILRNSLLTATTVLDHLGEDPALLLVQIVRRLPRPLARASTTVLSHIPSRVARSLAALLDGNREALQRRLDDAIDARVSHRTAARLADIALVANLPGRADGLLRTAGRAAATRARRSWYDGDMSGAIRMLTAAGVQRKSRRLASELRVFEGWTPTLPPIEGYRPAEKTVLHVLTNSLPHTGSGYAQRSHSILKTQSELGWNVHAVTRLGYPVQVGRLFAAAADRLHGVTYHRLIPHQMPAGVDERLQLQAELTLQLALRIRPAVIHTTTHFVNALVAAEVARVLGIPWVYEVRGQLADTWAAVREPRARTSERYRLFTEREAAAVRSAASVVTLGDTLKQRLSGIDGVRGPVILSPNAVGDHFLTEPLDPREARSLLGLAPDGVLVGSVSSIVDYEGLDILARAVALLASSNPSLRCLVVGDGAAAPGLRLLARDLGLERRMIFTGRVPREKAHLYHQALDIFVVPRRDLEVTRRVTPLKPAEAMASARVVVASDLPALREIVEHDMTGKLVAPENVEALAATIRALLNDDGTALSADAVALGAAGRQRVLQKRTWSSTVATMLDSYVGLEVRGR